MTDVRGLFKDLPGIVYRCLDDEHWTIIELTAGAEALYGYPAEDFIQNNRRSFSSIVHPDDRNDLREYISEVLQKSDQFDLEYRIVSRSGQVKYVWEHGHRIAVDKPHKFELVGMVYEISANSYAINRLNKSHHAIVNLARDSAIVGTDLTTYYQSVCRVLANTLDASRASIWLFDLGKKNMLQKMLWDTEKQGFEQGMVLQRNSLPRYFEAMLVARAIDAADAVNDPRTAEFAETYLKPLNIASKLDAGIISDSTIVGVVCVEHLGAVRNWSPGEVRFVVEVADQIAQALSARERRIAEDAMMAAMAESRAKSNFLAIMSHEIRTPLNGILGMAELLGDTSLDAQQRRYLKTINISSELLLNIINDILDFSKIEAGKLELIYNEYSLEVLIDACVDVFTHQSQEGGVKFFVEIAPDVPDTVVGDRNRLQQVLVNLLGNAFKFTDQGHIWLRVRKTEDINRPWLVFEVEDTGIGIPAEKIPDLFQPFNQLQNSERVRAAGTGLGLAICRRLIGLMGGEITVSSKMGSGSLFKFSIPLQEVTVSHLSISSDTAIAGKTVFLVDDDDVFVEFCIALAKRQKFKLISAKNGAEALEMLSALQPDIIVIDVMLPDINGIELARDLAQTSKMENIGLVLVSGDLGGRKALRSIRANLPYHRVLEKPVSHSAFCEALREALKFRSQVNVDVVKDDIARTLIDRRILVVEDNLVNQQVISGMLAKLQLCADICNNGMEALEAITQQGDAYCLVLMDCEMPVMDGFDASRRIRNMEGKISSIPIVALTAHALPEYTEKALASGMDDVITKPLSLRKLTDKLAEILNI